MIQGSVQISNKGSYTPATLPGNSWTLRCQRMVQNRQHRRRSEVSGWSYPEAQSWRRGQRVQWRPQYMYLYQYVLNLHESIHESIHIPFFLVRIGKTYVCASNLFSGFVKVSPTPHVSTRQNPEYSWAQALLPSHSPEFSMATSQSPRLVKPKIRNEALDSHWIHWRTS